MEVVNSFNVDGNLHPLSELIRPWCMIYKKPDYRLSWRSGFLCLYDSGLIRSSLIRGSEMTIVSIIIEMKEGKVSMQERGYIERPKYLAQIEKFINKPVIKILTGMRRVGKSTILMMIKDEMLKDIPDEQKIYMNFESLVYLQVNNALQLSEYITERAGSASGKMYYFF